MSAAGNTCVHHIFLSINPSHLGLSPFTQAIHHSLDIKGCDLELKFSPRAYVHVLPIEAGFVGANNVRVLLIDIGTNSEFVLGNRERILSSSCATGPAFEGAQIKYGLCNAPRAIERVKVVPVTKEVHSKVISKTNWNIDSDTVKAKDICGSGIVNAVADMLIAGILQQNSRFGTDLKTPRLRVTENEWNLSSPGQVEPLLVKILPCARVM